MTHIHHAAALGFQRAADAYEKGRPEYPAEAVQCLIRELHLNASSTVIDLGAGTGKLTRQLLPSGATIIAVEPVEAMRQTFVALLPEVELVAGTAEAIPLPDGQADAVMAGQAFHWFATGAALREIHRVLKPVGRLALIWNLRDESVDWVAKLTGLIDKHARGVPSYRSGSWRRCFDETALFGPLQERHFDHVQRGTLATLLARVASISYISVLPDAEREQVLTEVRQLVEMHPLTQGRAEIEMPYRTVVYWCPKRPAGLSY